MGEIGYAAAPARLQAIVEGRPVPPFRDKELAGIDDPDEFYQNLTGANIGPGYRRGGRRPSEAQRRDPAFRAPSFSDDAPMPVPLPGCDFSLDPYTLIDYATFGALVDSTGGWRDKGLRVEGPNGFATRCTTKRRTVESDWVHLLYDKKAREAHRLQVLEEREMVPSRLEGPFPGHPMANFRVNGCVVAFKANGEYRFCLNFSGPPGDSANDYIESFNLIEVPYSTLRRLLRRIAVLEHLGATDMLGGKHDIDAAFKTCGVRPEDWDLFGFKVRNEADTADEYYFSKVGVFGNRTSGVNFLRVATAVCFFINYLGFPCELFCDDFYLFGPRNLVRAGMRCLEKFCAIIKLPLKASKRVEPASCVPFVGIDIDYVAREARIPVAYLEQLKEDITTGGWLLRRGHPRPALESLVGKLAHCAVCVRNGHLRLFHLRTSLRVSRNRNSVNLSTGAINELEWFLALAGTWNGRRSWPCLADELRPPTVHGWCDASSSHGMGGALRGSDGTVYFFSVPWDAATKAAWSVPAMETFAAATFVHLFGDRCKGKTLLVESDSRDTVHAWGRRVPGQSASMSWTLLAVDTACTVHDCDARVIWIAGQRNVVADAASRGRLERLMEFANGAPVIRLYPSPDWLRTWLPV